MHNGPFQHNVSMNYYQSCIKVCCALIMKQEVEVYLYYIRTYSVIFISLNLQLITSVFK